MSSDREDILMISEELKRTANDEEIQCIVSYMQGVTRGIQLERNKKFQPVKESYMKDSTLNEINQSKLESWKNKSNRTKKSYTSSAILSGCDMIHCKDRNITEIPYEKYTMGIF